MPDANSTAADAFETFRSYLEKEVVPLLPMEKREQILDGIVRAAYTFGGALLRRGAGSAVEWNAFTQPAPKDADDEENEPAPPKPTNVVRFPPTRGAVEEP